MDFIKELQEARMTRNENNLRVLTYTDCCERAFLSMLIIELLQQYPTYAIAAKRYAQRTTGVNGYRYFRGSSTDLYNFIYFIVGNDEALAKLKDPEAAKEIRQRTTLPLLAVNRYLRQLEQGAKITNSAELFINLERALHISNSDYKALRRYITSYNKLSAQERKQAVSRLLIAARAKLRSADIIDELEKLAADNNLETSNVIDNEPIVSVPDISMSGSDLSMYRYLVGADNLNQVKRFVELALAGKPIPADVMQAYLPAIKALDDIVKGGPAFIQLLRQLQKRAKNSRK